MEKKTVQIDYPELRDWLACPECQSRNAKVEKGSLQLFCPDCKTRQNLLEDVCDKNAKGEQK